MKTPPISYPTVSSMKPAKVPFRDVRKDIIEEESGERRVLIDEGNITESGFSFSSLLSGFVVTIVAVIIGVAVFIPTIQTVIDSSNMTNPMTNTIMSLAPLGVAVVVLVAIIGTLFRTL